MPLPHQGGIAIEEPLGAGLPTQGRWTMDDIRPVVDAFADAFALPGR